MRKGPADDLRLLVDFLRHEMTIIALVDQHGRSRRLDLLPFRRIAVRLVKLRGSARQHDEISVLQIGDRRSKRSQGERVGTKKHFTRSLAFAKANCQRGTAAGADQEIVLALENQGKRESAL